MSQLFSRKNMNLLVGFITLLIVLWLIMFAIPSIFVNLFDTILGNLILLSIILLTTMYDLTLGIGFGVVLLIIWRFSHMSVGYNFL